MVRAEAGILTVFTVTLIWSMFGTAVLGIVTFAKPVVPVVPVAVSRMVLPVKLGLVRLALVLTEQVRPLPQLTVTGAVTVILTSSKSVRVPSETIILTVYLAGPWAEVGVQEKTPAGVIVAPDGKLAEGAELREKVKVWAGMSGSVAVVVKVRTASARTVLSLTGASTGASFTSLTWIPTVLV